MRDHEILQDEKCLKIILKGAHNTTFPALWEMGVVPLVSTTLKSFSWNLQAGFTC